MFKNPFEANTDGINVDKKLQLSQPDLVVEIKKKITVQKVPKNEKLKLIKKFPSTGVLATLSLKVYENLEKVEVPDGWQLLTTACNKEVSNGYFGAAFWHPEQHYVVVAHRGTEMNNIGSVIADLAGVVFNNYAGQMESACTFADEIVTTMQTVEKENEDIHFELFFTGHSLGGWLAQITTFSTEFLRRNDDTFIRLTSDEIASYHAITTVFDSPGCLPMLLKLRNKFEDFDCEAIDLDNLCITSYLSAPNQINTCNEHFGKVYRIFIDTSNMTFMDRNLGYTLAMHSIANIVNCFIAQKDSRVQEVIEWPIRDSITNGQELDKFLKYADYRNRFHLIDISKKFKETAAKIQIRYKTKPANLSNLIPMTVFTKREQRFLEKYRWIRRLPEYEIIRAILKDINIPEETLSSYDIVDRNVFIFENIRIFVPKVKLLLKIFPIVAEKLKSFLAEHKIREKVLAFETENCLNKLKNDFLEFNSSSTDLKKFFEKQFSHLKVQSGNISIGLSMIYKSFEKSRDALNIKSLFVLDLKRFSIINDLIRADVFLASSEEKFLMIIFCNENYSISDNDKKSFENLFDALSKHQNVNIILITEAESEFDKVIRERAKDKLHDNVIEVEKSFKWSELTSESQKKLLGRHVDFSGSEVKLENLFDSSTNLNLNEKAFLQLLNEDNLEINADPLMPFDFSVCTSEFDKIEIKPKMILENLEHNSDIYVISGIYDESLDDVSRKLIDILKPADGDQNKLIERNIVIGVDKLDKVKGKLHILSTVGSDKCLEDFDEKCRNYYPVDEDTRIHWIKIKDGKLSWRKSYNFNSFIERRLKLNSRLVDELPLNHENKKLIAVVGEVGEGKSAFLTHLARDKSKSFWVIHLDFGDLPFDDFKPDEMDRELLVSLIGKTAGYDPDNHLQTFILLHKLNAITQHPVMLIFDGFHDIQSDKDRAKALKLLQFVKDETKCFTILALRNADQLLDLQPSIFTFDKLNRSDKETMLKEIWKTRFSNVWGHEKCSEIFDKDRKSKFKTFAQVLLDQLDMVIDKRPMGIPKQLKLLADGFQDDFEKFIQIYSIKNKILDGLKIKKYYQHYINTKYDFYVTAKTGVASIDKKGKILLKTFKRISVDSLLPQEVRDLLNNRSEYLSPDYIISQLTKGQTPPKMLAIMLGYLFTDSRCVSLRSHLNKHNEILPRAVAFDITEDNVKQIVGLPMITACKEGQDNILKFLIDILKKKPDIKDIKLGLDDSHKNAFDYAMISLNASCVKLLLEFLLEHGEKEVFDDIIRNLDIDALRFSALKSENRELCEWFEAFILNNDLK